LNDCPPNATGAGSQSFSEQLYRERNLIERFFSGLKHYRGIAARRQLPRDGSTRLNAVVAALLLSLRPWRAAKFDPPQAVVEASSKYMRPALSEYQNMLF
jgi:hypothetical protein